MDYQIEEGELKVVHDPRVCVDPRVLGLVFVIREIRIVLKRFIYKRVFLMIY